VAAIIGLSALSWIYIEKPVRQGALGRLWVRVKAGELRDISGQIRIPSRSDIPSPTEIWSRISIPSPSDIRSRLSIPSGSDILSRSDMRSRFSIPTRIGISGRVDFRGWRPTGMARRRGVAAGLAIAALLGVVSVGVWGASGSAKRAITPPHAAKAPGKVVKTTPPPATPPTPPPTTTSCQSVVHIGDSTSEGLTSTSYLPDPNQRIDAQYARVGATSFDSEISGARSIVERYKNEPNADDVAKRLIGQGYQGCWVLALGTNEAADVAVGSSVGLSERVDRMMADVGNEPVMWVNVKSLLGSGPYAESHMADWDSALVNACSKYPNMRIFDWASVVQDSWFINDGIHFTTPGYAARSRMIADSLVKAFPAGGGSSSSCVVR
jgi:hypothetical protein